MSVISWQKTLGTFLYPLLFNCGCEVGQIISCSCLFETFWGGIRKPDLSSRLFPGYLTCSHTLLQPGLARIGAFLELCQPLTRTWLLLFWELLSGTGQKHSGSFFHTVGRSLDNNLISMSDFLEIPAHCTKVQGVCWLFLSNLFCRCEILQKANKERQCFSS